MRKIYFKMRTHILLKCQIILERMIKRYQQQWPFEGVRGDGGKPHSGEPGEHEAATVLRGEEGNEKFPLMDSLRSAAPGSTSEEPDSDLHCLFADRGDAADSYWTHDFN